MPRSFNEPLVLSLDNARDWHPEIFAGDFLRMVDYTQGATVRIKFDTADDAVQILKNGSGWKFPPRKTEHEPGFGKLWVSWDAQPGAKASLAIGKEGAEYLPGTQTNAVSIVDAVGAQTGIAGNPMSVTVAAKTAPDTNPDSGAIARAVGSRLMAANNLPGTPQSFAATSTGTLTVAYTVPAGKTAFLYSLQATPYGWNEVGEITIKDNVGTVQHKWNFNGLTTGTAQYELLNLAGEVCIEMPTGWTVNVQHTVGANHTGVSGYMRIV